MPFPTTPVVPRTTDELNVIVDVLKETSAPQRPVRHLPKKNCLSPTARGSLPAKHHAPTHDGTHGPTRFLWTTSHRCGRRGQMGPPVGGGILRTGVLTYVACRDNGTKTTVQTTTTHALAGLDKMTSVERAARRGKTRTGGRRACTLMVWLFFAAMLLTVDVVEAVFAPADRVSLKDAVGTCTENSMFQDSAPCTGRCLGETADGSCPNFAASHDASGNPYGVIGAWDVSAVTSMSYSKCNRVISQSLSLSVLCSLYSLFSVALWPRLFTPSRLLLLCVEYTTTRVSSDNNSHTFCYFCFVFVTRYLFDGCGL